MSDDHLPQRIFSPGAAIGMHLRVERVVRVGGDRVHYLVNNLNPRWYTRKCWACGNKHSPAQAQACTYCSRPLGVRRFLMSARSDPASSLEYQAFAHRRLRYKSLASPSAIYRYKGQLLACFPWNRDQLLISEPAPLVSPVVLSVAFQLADALSFLHAYGVILKYIRPSNILVAPNGSVRLFDLEVDRLVDRSLPPSDDPTSPPLRDMRELAAMMERYISIEDEELRGFFTKVRRGAFKTADDLASGISHFAYTRNNRHPHAGAAACMTDSGIVRSGNEDHWVWRPIGESSLRFLAVSDGMGGYEDGAAASSLASRTMVRQLRRRLANKQGHRTKDLKDALVHALKQTHTAVHTLASERTEIMGTTCVAALIENHVAVVGNVGDSRAYLFREGNLCPITEDQSMVAAMVAAGKITRSEMAKHPKANILLQFLGNAAEVDPDIYELDLRAGDRLLLCTDGLWGEVEESRIERLLAAEHDPRRAVRRLIRAANDAGGHDNITALVIDIPQ